MKIITFYLPQFHQIPENDKWWGKGFTEWTNMKKAKPLYLDHYMPRVPQNNNYYDLSKLETLKWQSELAKKYGIYGFAFYHYWFNGKKLLETPLEMLLSHPEIEQKFCISWANEYWTNGWVSDNNDILIAHNNNDSADWDRHFYYLLPFFRDPRYITEEGKPVIILYFPDILQKCRQMIERWRYLARENGLPGLFIMYQKAMSHYNPLVPHNSFDGGIEFHPGYVWYHGKSNLEKRKSEIRFYLSNIAKLQFGLNIKKKRNVSIDFPKRFDYDSVWGDILALKPENLKMYPGAFVGWDNTPRKGSRGSVVDNATPEKFRRYMTEQVRRAKNIYHKDMLFLFAWNEWAEGGYLEPDEKYKTGYLEAIYNALQKNGEIPEFI